MRKMAFSNLKAFTEQEYCSNKHGEYHYGKEIHISYIKF